MTREEKNREVKKNRIALVAILAEIIIVIILLIIVISRLASKDDENSGEDTEKTVQQTEVTDIL